MIGNIVVLIIISSLVSPMYLAIMSPIDTQYVFGNPRPIYFYDVDSSCNPQEIKTSLDYITTQTGVKFFKLWKPVALLGGGIDYTCDEYDGFRVGEDGGYTSGTAESGYFSIFVWNKIRLYMPDDATIIHETLHIMSFAHSKNENSIMYPIGNNWAIEPELSNFIQKVYVHNPFAYLNTIPVHLLLALLVLFAILTGRGG